MSVRAIEAEVSIKSGVSADVTIGREVIRTVYVDPVLESLSVMENGLYEPAEGVDGYSDVTVNVPPIIPDIEPLAVTANGVYTAEGDGFNPVTVNVPIPTDPNVCEGEFIGTETGVLTINLPYTGDSYPKALFIYDADGIVRPVKPRAYTMTGLMLIKQYADFEPDYETETSKNAFRLICTYPGTSSYTSGVAASVYTLAQAEPNIGASTSVKMSNNKTLKVFVTDVTSSSSRFVVGNKYKYQVFY